MSTIFALASARGKAGVSVIRISGPNAFSALENLGCVLPEPRRAAVRKIQSDGVVLDEALVLTFPRPGSFTGEDVVELHLHGSVAVVNAVINVLTGFDDCRHAEPGEFTRRALENGRLDLTQVEGLSDLIESETEVQRRQALRTLSGALAGKADVWRTDLVRAAALLEATIDFVDEEVPVDVTPEVSDLIEKTIRSLRSEVRGVKVAERIREGFEVAIVGAPNVGKSTLLNALAGREAAITSEFAGTTRDVIEVRLELAGLPVTLLDTAGLRETDDFVESIGVGKAVSRAESADLRLILLDKRGGDLPMSPKEGDLVLVPKADLQDGDFSALSGDGLDDVVQCIGSILEQRASMAGVAVRARHGIAMRRAIEALGIASERLNASTDLAELVAEDIRRAVRALESLVGRVDVEDLLDEIFSSFCVGK